MAAASAAIDVLHRFVVKVVIELINPLMLLLAAGAFVAFLWGVVKFIMAADDSEKRKEGRDTIVWGLVGLVIIFGAYGLLNLVVGFFNLGPVNSITGQ